MAQVVSFDPIRKLIIEIDTGGDNSIDIIEVYSEWKVWYAENDNAKYSPAMRTVGGDPISDVQNLGATFFLINGWRFKPAERNHRLELVGNWFTDPAGGNTVVATDGAFSVLVSERVSNLTDSSVARLDLAALQDRVYVDSLLGNDTNGDGTPTNPVQTLSAAYTIATNENLRAFSLDGTFLLDQNYTNWRFLGTVDEANATVDMNNYTVDKCAFQQVTLTGDGGGVISAARCILDSSMGISGRFIQCGVAGFFAPGNNTSTVMSYCWSEVAGNIKPIFDLGAVQDADFQARGYTGGMDLRNVDVATQSVSVDSPAIRLTIDSSCTDGDMVLGGTGDLVDNSAGMTLIKDSFVYAPDIEINRKIYSNRQRIDITTNRLIIYDDDGVTPLAQYDLFDANNNPTSVAIYERVPI